MPEPTNLFEQARKRRLGLLLRQPQQPAQEQAAAVVTQADMSAERPVSALERLRAMARQTSLRVPEEQLAALEQDDGAQPEAALEDIRVEQGTVLSVRRYQDWAVAMLRLDAPQRSSVVDAQALEVEEDDSLDVDPEDVALAPVLRLTGSAVQSLKEGLRYKVQGRMRTHPIHGESLEVQVAHPVLEADAGALHRFLVKHYEGVGHARARRYLKALKEHGGPAMLERLRDVLLQEPWRLDVEAVVRGEPRVELQGETAQEGAVDGGDQPSQRISPEQAAALQAAHQARLKTLSETLARTFMLQLGSLSQFREPAARALARYYAPRVIDSADPPQVAWGLLVANPYEPIGVAGGYGFLTADAVARKLGVAPDAPVRLRALGGWLLEQSCQRAGHTWVSAQAFAQEVRRHSPDLKPQDVLNAAVQAGTVVVEAAEGRIYPASLYNAEVRLAQSLAQRIADAEPLSGLSYEQVIDRLKRHAADINPAFAEQGLDEAQLHAVASIMTAPTGIHVLRGGPGTGKTTIVECITWLLKKDKSFAFAAPTGKAARVLTQRVRAQGFAASTICSLLRGTDETGYEVNARNPLACDVLVIDETTMVGLRTADAILQAAPAHAHIIFLGDPGRLPTEDQAGRAGQLPSIAPGRFMQDLQIIEGVQSLELKRVFRNAGGILDVVEEVARGKLDVRDRESVTFSDLPQPQQAMQTVLARYLELARRDGMANTVLVCPKRAGSVDEPGWNVTWLNAVLREALNRDGIKMPGTVFRLGDRIIVRQNMKSAAPAAEELRGRATQADLKQVQRAAGIETVLQSSEEESQRLVNGDTGFIVGWRQASETQIGLPAYVRLLLDDGRLVWLSGDDVAVLDHAYALTVHAVQGSEYRNVLVCMTPGSDGFINANMVLTAFSRAKALLQVWGDEDVLKKAAATALPARNTALAQRVREQIQGFTQRQNLGENKPSPATQDDSSKLVKRRAREIIEQSLASGVVLTPKVVLTLAQQHDLKATTLSFEISDMLAKGEVLPQHVWDVQQQGLLQEALPKLLDELGGQEPRLKDLRDMLQQRLSVPVDYVQLRVALMVVRAQRQQQEAEVAQETCTAA